MSAAPGAGFPDCRKRWLLHETEMHAEDESESTLVGRARTGDPTALETLFARHTGALRARIHRRLSPAVRRRVADSDVLQQTLIVAARRIQAFEYRGEGSVRAWLTAIADNAAHKAVERHVRTHKRNVHAEVSRDARPATAQLRGAAASPSHIAMAEELQRRVERALRDMTEDHRTVVQLLQHRRVTLVEAAELMGRSVNAVKKLHARALADLADRLGIDGRGPR